MRTRPPGARDRRARDRLRHVTRPPEDDPPPMPERELHVHAWGDEGARCRLPPRRTAWGGHFACSRSASRGPSRACPTCRARRVALRASCASPTTRRSSERSATRRLARPPFGGRLAFEHAARRPGTVERLVLLDLAILLPQHVAPRAAENARRDRGRELRGRHRPPRGEPAPRGATRPRRDGAPRAPHRTRRRVALPLRAGLGRDGVSEMSSALPAFDDVRVPTLLVLGELVPLVRPLAGRAIEGTGDLLDADRAGQPQRLVEALDEIAARSARLARCWQGPTQTTYSSAIASAWLRGSRSPRPPSSRAVIVSGGTTMTTFQWVMEIETLVERRSATATGAAASPRR